MGRTGWLWELYPAAVPCSRPAPFPEAHREPPANSDPRPAVPSRHLGPWRKNYRSRRAPRRGAILVPAAGAGGGAAQPWRCSRLSLGPPSPGSPPPAAPRAPPEVKSWENRLCLSSSPAALGTRRQPPPAVLAPRGAAAGAALPRGSGPSARNNHRPEAAERGTGDLRLLLVVCFFFFLSFSPPLALAILKSVF